MFSKTTRVRRLKVKLKVNEAKHNELRMMLADLESLPKVFIERQLDYTGKIASLKCKIEELGKP